MDDLEKKDSSDSQERLGAFIDRKIRYLYNIRDYGTGKAALAHLKNAIGKPPGSVANISEYVIEGVPGKAYGDAPTNQEIATHYAMTLYAFHQQGKTESMHRSGISLGAAIARFEMQTNHPADEKKSSIRTRMDAVTLSNGSASIASTLRGIVGQLKSKDIPLDYGRLAEDICSLLYEKRNAKVPLYWGRSYHQEYRNQKKNQIKH